jgi:hypothetical protein
MNKLKEVTLRLLEEEAEKLRLSADNFSLKQILKENGIAFEL